MTATEWELTLPYSSPPLSQNKSVHHMDRYRWRKQLQDDALILARAARLPKGLRKVLIELHWQPASKRGRDTDNCVDTLKPLIDGVVKKYGLCEDDSSEFVRSEVIIEPVLKPARMWLRIVDVSEQDELFGPP